MTPAWGFLILATLMVVGGMALSWAGAVRRKRHYEVFILRKAKRAGGGQ
jgi:Trk-type K+ transport system membrane component